MRTGRPKAELRLSAEEQAQLSGLVVSRSLPHALVASASVTTAVNCTRLPMRGLCTVDASDAMTGGFWPQVDVVSMKYCTGDVLPSESVATTENW